MSKPLSVLLVVDSYPPVLGGSEIEAQRVSSAMIRRGHRVEVLCAGGPPMPARRAWIDPAGVPVRILTRWTGGRLKDISFALQTAWILWTDRKKYDVVYFLMQGLHLAAGLPMGRFLRKPMVMKFGGSGVVPFIRASRVGKWELNWMQQWKVPVLVLNEGMTQEALADGFSAEQITWMPNPVDVDEFRPAPAEQAAEFRRQQRLSPTAVIATYVGRLSHEKGLPELLRSFARAVPQCPEALLLLIGDGAQRAELEALARTLDLGPGHIRFVGRVDVREVPAWLQASDIFTLLSPNEGFSCALLEAMSVGLASVVTDIPANRQLVEPGVHGLAVPFGDDDRAGDAFTALLTDPVARQRMGQLARQRVVENYSMPRVVERYEALFSKIMRSPSQPALASTSSVRE